MTKIEILYLIGSIKTLIKNHCHIARTQYSQSYRLSDWSTRMDNLFNTMLSPKGGVALNGYKMVSFWRISPAGEMSTCKLYSFDWNVDQKAKDQSIFDTCNRPVCHPTACSTGYYGDNCNMNCGNCFNDETCHFINGSCLSGCRIGYQPPFCAKGNIIVQEYIVYNEALFWECLIPHKTQTNLYCNKTFNKCNFHSTFDTNYQDNSYCWLFTEKNPTWYMYRICKSKWVSKSSYLMF